jgi:hypothetical protein
MFNISFEKVIYFNAWESLAAGIEITGDGMPF